MPILAAIAYVRESLFIRINRRNWQVILLQAFSELGATLAFLTTLSKMPLTNVTVILQSLPLTVTMSAAIFFGKKVGWWR